MSNTSDRVDLSDPDERSLATATCLGYMAGLAGREPMNPFVCWLDSHAWAWADGYEQGEFFRVISHL